MQSQFQLNHLEDLNFQEYEEVILDPPISRFENRFTSI